MLVVGLLEGEQPFYYDSLAYWNLGGSFVRDGTFSLLNFDDPTRGYLWPVTMLALSELAHGLEWTASSLITIFNAVVFALIATVLAPALANLAWPEQRWGLWRRLGMAALVLVFWRSYLNFPLTDFPALAAALVALLATARSESPGWMLVTGVASAAAINMRPAYIVLIPAVLCLVAMAWWRQRGAPRLSVGRLVLCGLLLVLGFTVISLPQSLSTHRHHDRWSFVPGAAGGLSSLQFTEGMRLQRYETFVGSGQPGPSMRYADRTGERILQQRGDATIDNVREYLGVVASHPLDIGGVFARHVINGFDQRYSTPYVENLGSQRSLRLVGFLLVFLALVRLAWPTARRSLGHTRWRYLAALLLCASPVVASAVETRFLLPAYLLVYLTVLAPGWPNPFPSTHPVGTRIRTAGLLIASFALYMAIVLHVVNNATRQLRVV